MKFPILIHLLNNKARHVVMSADELPREHYFKIVRTGVDPNESIEIEVEYRRTDEVPTTKEEKVDEPPQENNEPPELDSSADGASSGSTDSDGASL